jgi:nucleoside-triphosphatase THEP1
MPGSGKTTLFRRLCDELRHLDPVGFYTAEIRQGTSRRGFRLAFHCLFLTDLQTKKISSQLPVAWGQQQFKNVLDRTRVGILSD